MGDLAKIQSIQSLLDQAVSLGVGSGMAASFGKIDDLFLNPHPTEIYSGQIGWVTQASPVQANTVFDLASLTKILATTLLAMKQFEVGKLQLDETLSTLFPERVKVNPTLKPVTVRQLLTHTSGLPAWKPFYLELQKKWGTQLPFVSTEKRKKFFLDLLYQIHLESVPGTQVVYSDLGILILEDILSPFLDCDAGALWAQMTGCGLHYRPIITDSLTEQARIQKNGESVAMTENCPWRGLLQGQVHDDNTWSLGGIAGHAGVFGTLRDVCAWIRGVFSGTVVSTQTLRVFFDEATPGLSTRRALGFDLPPQDGSGSTGIFFSQNSVGHLGFTGTSLWIDLDSGDYAVLLTNRVHPMRNDIRIRDLRRRFHEMIRT